MTIGLDRYMLRVCLLREGGFASLESQGLGQWIQHWLVVLWKCFPISCTFVLAQSPPTCTWFPLSSFSISKGLHNGFSIRCHHETHLSLSFKHSKEPSLCTILPSPPIPATPDILYPTFLPFGDPNFPLNKNGNLHALFPFSTLHLVQLMWCALHKLN